MIKVVVAFENGRNAQKVKELLEASGTASCLICRSAAEVRRLVRKQHLPVVICGFKLPDDSCESLRGDLPDGCAMLMVAGSAQLELCQREDISKLTAPAAKSDLIASVHTLLQSRAACAVVRPQRSEEERAMVAQAKAALMERRGMTESQAHRFLQKQSMDSGSRLTDTARRVLEEAGALPPDTP